MKGVILVLKGDFMIVWGSFVGNLLNGVLCKVTTSVGGALAFILMFLLFVIFVYVISCCMCLCICFLFCLFVYLI